jgi:polar amino acid transport system substrate-binding protein
MKRKFLVFVLMMFIVCLMWAKGTQEKGIIEKIKQRGELIVGIEATFPPFESIEGGQIIGLDPDLTKLLAEALGVKYKLIDIPLSGAIPALLAGKYDAIISGVTITPERAKKVGFCIPYAEATPVFLVAASDSSSTPRDLVGKKIAVQLGGAGETQAMSWTEELAKQYGNGFGEILRFNTYPDIILALEARRADAAIGDLISHGLVMGKNPGKFKIISGLGERAFFGIAVRKEDIALKNFFDQQIREYKRLGKLEELQKKWLGLVSEVPDELPDFAK